MRAYVVRSGVRLAPDWIDAPAYRLALSWSGSPIEGLVVWRGQSRFRYSSGEMCVPMTG